MSGDGLAALLQLDGDRPWTVLLQSPVSAWFAHYEAGSWRTAPAGLGADVGLPDGPPESWAGRVFEATGWDGSSQVRWVRGRHAVRVDAPPAHAGHLTTRVLLFGTAGEQCEGWTLMRSPRAGCYAIPARITPGQRACITVRECLGIDSAGRTFVESTLWTGITEVEA